MPAKWVNVLSRQAFSKCGYNELVASETVLQKMKI